MDTTRTLTLALVGGLGGLSTVPVIRWLNEGGWRKPDEPGRTTVNRWAAAVMAGATWVLIWWRLGTVHWWPAALGASVLAVSGLAVVVIDTSVQRVPEPLVLWTYAGVAAALVTGALVSGQWAAFGRALSCGAILWCGFFLYALLSRLGFADIQLMGLAGLVLGWIGWWPGLMVAAVALLIGGGWATVLLLAGRRGTFAFAPTILAGVAATILLYT